MTTRILLTTTSYQDTPGPHHNLLESSAYEVVRERGPLPEEKMLELAGEFDAFLWFSAGRKCQKWNEKLNPLYTNEHHIITLVKVMLIT